MKPDDTLTFYTDDTGQHRWRVRAANGETIAASSEGYTERRGAEENAERVLGWVADAKEDEPA